MTSNMRVGATRTRSQTLNTSFNRRTTPTTLSAFVFSQRGRASFHTFCWEPDRVLFRSLAQLPDGTEALVAEWEYTGAVPEPGHETPRINLWLHRGNPPIDRQPVEVVIRRFQHLPLEE
ncbi:MAG: hypothetical protein KatS3mg115_1987 [Candidatus Poribacteria bacterium]|nr:MAG: hypothetical protein KatS3mg115_1987 [Candidatus Poribacteria bacterium]